MLLRRFIYCLCLALLSCRPAAADSLRIAVASSLQFAAKDLAAAYTQQSGQKCEIISGSSGKLTAQIIAGAPYDIFISADLDYPRQLFERQLATVAPRKVGAGELRLFSRFEQSPTIFDLVADSIKTIAVANPAVAPYGRAAIDALKAAGVYEKIEVKLVYGESVGQTNQLLMAGAVDVMLTSLASFQNQESQFSFSNIDPGLYTYLPNGLVVLKNAPPAAEQFADFVLSEQGQEILNAHDLWH